MTDQISTTLGTATLRRFQFPPAVSVQDEPYSSDLFGRKSGKAQRCTKGHAVAQHVAAAGGSILPRQSPTKSAPPAASLQTTNSPSTTAVHFVYIRFETHQFNANITHL